MDPQAVTELELHLQNNQIHYTEMGSSNDPIPSTRKFPKSQNQYETDWLVPLSTTYTILQAPFQ